MSLLKRLRGLRKRRVLVVNPIYCREPDIDTLGRNSRLPIVIDPTIEHSFEVKAVE